MRTFPVNIAGALSKLGSDGIDGTLAYERECEGAKYHSPTPLILHEVLLDQSNPDSDKVWLCGTCRDNLAVHCHLLDRSDGQLPWEVRREFGNLIRNVGERAWAMRGTDDDG